MHVAVIGGGPAGFFCCAQLLKRNIKVSLFEQRLMPFGLLRYGVAPDYPLDNLLLKFEDIGSKINYMGNIKLGKDIHLDDLKQVYSGVICANNNWEANMEGTSAQDIVGWYTGDPLCSFVPELKPHVYIRGMGNVALDIARVLLSPVELFSRHISPNALKLLQKQIVQKVTILGRRGPKDVAFTLPELRRLHKVCRIQIPSFYGTGRLFDFMNNVPKQNLNKICEFKFFTENHNDCYQATGNKIQQKPNATCAGWLDTNRGTISDTLYSAKKAVDSLNLKPQKNTKDFEQSLNAINWIEIQKILKNEFKLNKRHLFTGLN